MSTPNSTFSDRAAIVGVVDPDAYTASASYDKLTDAIDMSTWGRVAFVVTAGDIEDTGTVDFKVTECATADGTYTDLAGKAITQLTTDDDDKQAVVEVSADGRLWQPLGTFPRDRFAGDPVAVRLGKSGPGARPEDYSLPGPEGKCQVKDLRVFGR